MNILKIGEIAKIKTGKLDSNAANSNGIYPFFTCDPQTLMINEFAYDTEAVLLAGNNASGNYTAKYYCGKFNAYQRVYIIEAANKEVLDTKFLCYVLNLQLRILKGMSAGSTTKFLTLSMIKNLSVYCPPLPIQRKIAGILSAYDDLIENNRRQIKLLEEAARRLYKEWFVDLRFPGHEQTDMVDGLPAGWERKKLGEIADMVGGGTPSTEIEDYYCNGIISWVVPTDITRNDGIILLDTEKKITELGLRNSSAKIVPPGTILMTSRASVGYFGMCDFEVCTNQGFISLVPKNISMQMYMLLNLLGRVDEIRQKAGGSTYLEISKKVFREFDIVMPSYHILIKFQSIVSNLLTYEKIVKKKLMMLQEARDRLLPKLMSGEIEVE